MAHAIDQTTGRAAVFVTGEPAWHRLGVVIENATTSAEAIEFAVGACPGRRPGGNDQVIEQFDIQEAAGFDQFFCGYDVRAGRL